MQPEPNRQATRRAAANREPDQLVVELACLQTAKLPAHDFLSAPVCSREASEEDGERTARPPQHTTSGKRIATTARQVSV